MEISEIKKLIPFYVAGTLDEVERKLVENALKESKELQKEVEFWLKAQAIVEYHSQFYQEGHLTPEQIVIAAESGIKSIQTAHPDLIRHLQECEHCRHDVEMIKSTYPVEETVSIPKKHQEYLRTGYVGRFKFADVFAAAAVILIIVTFFFTDFNKQKIPSIPQEHYANLILSYNQSTRGDASTEIPILALDSNTTRINIVVYVPHSEIDSLRYAVAISLPSGADITISNELLPSRFDSTFDTIRFEVGREFFKTVPTKYRLTLSEILPPSKSYLTPESYIFTFCVR